MLPIWYLVWSVLHLMWCSRTAGIILGMSSTNERRHYIVMSSLIGWAHTQNDLFSDLPRQIYGLRLLSPQVHFTEYMVGGYVMRFEEDSINLVTFDSNYWVTQCKIYNCWTKVPCWTSHKLPQLAFPETLPNLLTCWNFIQIHMNSIAVSSWLFSNLCIKLIIGKAWTPLSVAL